MSERGWGHERIARALDKAGLAGPVVRVTAGTEVAGVPRPAVFVGTLAAAHAIEGAAAVCVADLDQLLMRPDFRAGEYALQTLHSLAGSLAHGGRFLVQTREPEHHVVQSFTRGSYRYFLDRELPFRRDAGYPPFGAVVRVELSTDEVDDLRQSLAGTDAVVVGAVSRRGRTAALVRAPELAPLLDPLHRFSLSHPRSRIDVDPTDVA